MLEENVSCNEAMAMLVCRHRVSLQVQLHLIVA